MGTYQAELVADKDSTSEDGSITCLSCSLPMIRLFYKDTEVHVCWNCQVSRFPRGKVLCTTCYEDLVLYSPVGMGVKVQCPKCGAIGPLTRFTTMQLQLKYIGYIPDNVPPLQGNEQTSKEGTEDGKAV